MVTALATLAPGALVAQGTRTARERPTFDAVVAGMQCKQSRYVERQVDCDYVVGEGLSFTIAGIGDSAVAVTVTKATGYDSDYYFTFGVGNGCIIVKPGRKATEAAVKRGQWADMAFVSPRNGKVHKTWQECAAVR